MAHAKAPKNSGSQGFTHTSSPAGSSVKNPATPMSVGGTPSKPAQPMCTEMGAVAGSMTGTSGGGMAESM